MFITLFLIIIYICLYNYFFKTTFKKQFKTIKSCFLKTPYFIFSENGKRFMIIKCFFQFFILKNIKLFLKIVIKQTHNFLQ